MSAVTSAPLGGLGASVSRVVASRRRRRELLASHLFDKEWYLRTYDDVKKSGEDPLRHFLRVGSAEGRSPGPTFDTEQYLRRYRDVAASGIEPWRHYYLHGRSESRVANTADEERASIDSFRQKLTELENQMRLVFSAELPLARLAQVERISAQWQATVPRLLDRNENISGLRAEVKALSARVAALGQAED